MKIPVVTNPEFITNEKTYKELQASPVADRRMRAGREKYGKSWAEVNLKEDMLEEAYDLINYAILGIVRIERSMAPMNEDDYSALETIKEMAKDIIVQISFLPDFEGPTSNDWLEQNGV